jgi:hypothetical protein
VFSAYLRWWDAHPWVVLIVIVALIFAIAEITLRARDKKP